MTTRNTMIAVACRCITRQGAGWLLAAALIAACDTAATKGDAPKPITFNPQINITTSNPTGAYVPFYLWWNSPGDAGWPNYTFSDLHDSIDKEPADYPQEDPNVYSLPPDQTANPSPNPTGFAPVPAISPSPWQQNHPYSLGDKVVPTTPNGHTYVCSQGGTSALMANMEPQWPTAIGTPQIQDNTVQWTEHTMVAIVGVSSQWSADSSNPVSVTPINAPAPGGGHEVNFDYALQKRFVPNLKDTYDIWLELKNDNSTPSEVRIVYALFKKTDPDVGTLVPLPVTDSTGVQHIFRRLRHGSSARYIVPPKTPRDHPYVITDLRVALTKANGIQPTDYVYVDVFLVDLKSSHEGRPFGFGGAMRRMQVQP